MRPVGNHVTELNRKMDGDRLDNGSRRQWACLLSIWYDWGTLCELWPSIYFGLIVSVRIKTRLFFREDGNIAIGPIQEEEIRNGNGIR